MSFKELLKAPGWLKKPAGIKIFSRGGRNDSGKYSNKLTYDELINAESALGRTLFGPIPAGHTRDFFKSRDNMWIWHESYIDTAGVAQEMTICYDVRPSGVYKKPLGGSYTKIEGAELDNFRKAAKNYFELVKNKLYS